MSGAVRTYGFINAKLRARISKVLSSAELEQLIRAPSLVEAMQQLRETSFADAAAVYAETGDLKTVELELVKREIRLFSEIERYVTGEVLALIAALTSRFEIENLKNVVRLWFDRVIRSRDIEQRLGYLLRVTIHHPLQVDALVRCNDVEEFAHHLEGTPYAVIVRRHAQEITASRSLFDLECDLDRYYYATLLAAADRLRGRDREIARRLIGVEIDLVNLNWIARLKVSYDLPLERALAVVIPSGWHVNEQVFREAYTAQNMQEVLSAVLDRGYGALKPLLSAQPAKGESQLLLVERILREITRHEVSRILVGYPFTVGTILAYFLVKQEEIRRVMTILNAKFYDVPQERIREMV